MYTIASAQEEPTNKSSNPELLLQIIDKQQQKRYILEFSDISDAQDSGLIQNDFQVQEPQDIQMQNTLVENVEEQAQQNINQDSSQSFSSEQQFQITITFTRQVEDDYNYYYQSNPSHFSQVLSEAKLKLQEFEQENWPFQFQKQCQQYVLYEQFDQLCLKCNQQIQDLMANKIRIFQKHQYYKEANGIIYTKGIIESNNPSQNEN